MFFKCVILFAFIIATEASSPQDDHYYHVDVSNRIVGGSIASEGSVPYMVALRTGIIIRSFICGGSIVTKQHVLTAAHCVDALYGENGLPRSLRVVVGTNWWKFGGQIISVARNITHENWDSLNVKNDLAILVTRSSIIYTRNVEAVPLNFDYNDGKVLARVAGWGRTKTGGPASDRLLELTVLTVDGEDCLNAFDSRLNESEQNIKLDPKIELCAFNSPDTGVCNGDSGSALVQVDTKEQFGVVSWGYTCAQGIPDVYVRLSSYGEWIKNALMR